MILLRAPDPAPSSASPPPNHPSVSDRREPFYAWLHPPSQENGGWESPLRLLGKREAPRCQTESALRWPHQQGRIEGTALTRSGCSRKEAALLPCWVHTAFAARTPDSCAPWKPQLSRRATRWERICFGAASQQLFAIESAASELTVKRQETPRVTLGGGPGAGREGTGSTLRREARAPSQPGRGRTERPCRSRGLTRVSPILREPASGLAAASRLPFPRSPLIPAAEPRPSGSGSRLVPRKNCLAHTWRFLRAIYGPSLCHKRRFLPLASGWRPGLAQRLETAGWLGRRWERLGLPAGAFSGPALEASKE